MDLVEKIYTVTKRFPKEEMYGLTSQLRRASVSVPSNIAEGKGRFSDRELTQFLSHARGSLFEMDTQLQLAERLKYVDGERCEPIRHEIIRVGQMLNGLIRSVRSVP
jgi:four helix bundle protein